MEQNRLQSKATAALAVLGFSFIGAQCNEPSLTISEGPIASFGDWPAGFPVSKTLTVTNAGGVDATLDDLRPGGLGLAPPFAYTGGSCAESGVIPANGGTCTLAIAFWPRAVGAASDTIELRYSWPGNVGASQVASRPVSGTGAPAISSCLQTGCPAQHVCKPDSADLTRGASCVFVPDPPPGCMAPCIWEARKNCLPVLSACTGEQSAQKIISCNATSGWGQAAYTATGALFADARASEIQKNGVTCLGLVDFAQQSLRYYSDGTRPIASADTRSSTVQCEDGTVYTEARAPECETWRATYLDPAQCLEWTAFPGSCAGTYVPSTSCAPAGLEALCTGAP